MLDVFLDLGEKVSREFVFVIELVEHLHSRLILRRLFFHLVNVVGDGTTGHRKADNTGKHDEDADDPLGLGRCREVSVPHRSDSRDRKVNAR